MVVSVVLFSPYCHYELPISLSLAVDTSFKVQIRFDFNQINSTAQNMISSRGNIRATDFLNVLKFKKHVHRFKLMLIG